MTKQRIHDKKAGRDRLALGEQNSHPFEDVLNDTYLFVERCKDIAAIGTKSVAENYSCGKVVLYVGLRNRCPHRKEYGFSFLIAKDVLELGGVNKQSVDITAVESEAVIQSGLDGHQSFPMFIGVGDLVDGPEGCIPSRVWALGANEVPLLRSEFLFQSVLPGQPFTWKFIGLPGVAVDAAEGEPYARRSSSVIGDNCYRRLVQRGAQSQNKVDDIERDIDVNVFIAACDYVRKIQFSLSAKGIGVCFQEPIYGRFEINKLALSTGDIFL